MRVLYQIYGAGNVAEATVRLCRKRQGTSEPRFGFALQNDRDSTLRMYQSKNLTRGQVFTLVRVRGIEPRSQVWKTCILTAVLHPQIDFMYCIIPIPYNKAMGFLSSRFNFNSSGGQFHSSGMTKGDSVTGSGSVQSFEQRQQVNKNRQVVGAYKDASVLRTYRDDAYSPDRDEVHYGPDVQKDLDEQKALRDKRSSKINLDEQSTSKIKQLHSSRIDVVKTTRQGFNAGQSAPEQPRRMPSRFGIEKPTFGEPKSRGYNPYQ